MRCAPAWLARLRSTKRFGGLSKRSEKLLGSDVLEARSGTFPCVPSRIAPWILIRDPVLSLLIHFNMAWLSDHLATESKAPSLFHLCLIKLLHSMAWLRDHLALESKAPSFPYAVFASFKLLHASFSPAKPFSFIYSFCDYHLRSHAIAGFNHSQDFPTRRWMRRPRSS